MIWMIRTYRRSSRQWERGKGRSKRIPFQGKKCNAFYEVLPNKMMLPARLLLLIGCNTDCRCNSILHAREGAELCTLFYFREFYRGRYGAITAPAVKIEAVMGLITAKENRRGCYGVLTAPVKLTRKNKLFIIRVSAFANDFRRRFTRDGRLRAKT